MTRAQQPQLIEEEGGEGKKENKPFSGGVAGADWPANFLLRGGEGELMVEPILRKNYSSIPKEGKRKNWSVAE